MKRTDEIIAAHGIDNPADATLIRLAGLAVAMPNEPIDSLVKRESFAHPRDAAVAHAFVEAIRANSQPVPVPVQKHWILAAAAAAALAIGLGAWAFDLTRELAKQRDLNSSQASQFLREMTALQSSTTAKVGELQTSTNSAIQTVGESSRALAQSLEQQEIRIKNLASENERLKAELAVARSTKQ